MRNLLIFLIISRSVDNFLINLSTGKIEGVRKTVNYSPLGSQNAVKFLGIPFAKPPIGNLRFRKPEKPGNWTGIRKADEFGSLCMSDPIATYKTTTQKSGPMSEDCLFLNVFTNDFCLKTKNCSVMLAIHGGRFDHETSSSLNPDILINNFVGQNRNIVVVTTNYRLGIFGFGHFGNGKGTNEEASNFALWDILESIHWIHREIHSFGGNSKLLTLAGHSGGGTLANAITSSPQSRGLIARQMIMSAPDGTKTRSSNSKILKTIGKRFNSCENFECLRNISAQELLDAQLNIYKFGRNFITEPHVDGEFITDYNDILMSSGNFQKIPTLIGTVTGEMSESIYSQDKNGVANLTRVRELCEHFAYRNGYSNPEILAGKCEERFGELVRPQFFSDEIEFFMPARRTARAHESSKNVLMYSYKYSGAGEVFNKYMENTPAPMHSEDLVYVFGTHRKSEKMKMKDYLIEKVYSGIFADFVNFKKPLENENENWEIFEENNGARYFEIDFDENGKLIGNGMRNGYYQDAHQFWNEDVKKNFPKTHMEIFPNSTDSLSMTVVIEPLESHHTQKSSDSYKNLETMELLYLEADEFLEDLKSGKISVLKDDLDHSHQSIHVFLLTVGCILLIAILYLAFTHWLMHRKREGYMLLK